MSFQIFEARSGLMDASTDQLSGKLNHKLQTAPLVTAFMLDDLIA
jgi:hypothetical protein